MVSLGVIKLQTGVSPAVLSRLNFPGFDVTPVVHGDVPVTTGRARVVPRCRNNNYRVMPVFAGPNWG